MTKVEDKKCAHPGCNCKVAGDKKHCGPHCEHAKADMKAPCGCAHPGCAA